MQSVEEGSSFLDVSTLRVVIRKLGAMEDALHI